METFSALLAICAGNSPVHGMASSLGDNVVDHVVCLKVEFLSHTVLSNENGEFYTTIIYPYLNRYVF